MRSSSVMALSHPLSKMIRAAWRARWSPENALAPPRNMLRGSWSRRITNAKQLPGSRRQRFSSPPKACSNSAKKHLCTTCHVVKGAKTIGPTYAEVAKKYAGQKDAEAKLADKVKKGGQGVWGQVPMPPNAAVPDADIKTLVKWVLSVK